MHNVFAWILHVGNAGLDIGYRWENLSTGVVFPPLQLSQGGSLNPLARQAYFEALVSSSIPAQVLYRYLASPSLEHSTIACE